jgi:hypothetical protein
VQRRLEGWRSTQVRGDDGVVHSDERVRAKCPVIAPSPAGALHLGERYWSEVGRASRGSLRRRDTSSGVELRLFAFGPSLEQPERPAPTPLGHQYTRIRETFAVEVLVRLPRQKPLVLLADIELGRGGKVANIGTARRRYVSD